MIALMLKIKDEIKMYQWTRFYWNNGDSKYTYSSMLVGSSRSNRSGRENNARANAKRIRHPPENVLVALACILLLKPKPFKITDARAGALSESICSSPA